MKYFMIIRYNIEYTEKTHHYKFDERKLTKIKSFKLSHYNFYVQLLTPYAHSVKDIYRLYDKSLISYLNFKFNNKNCFIKIYL